MTIGGNGDLSLINAGRKISVGVDLDPERLIRDPAALSGKPPRPAFAFSGNQLHGLPPKWISRGRGRTWLKNPVGMRCRFNIHVVDRE